MKIRLPPELEAKVARSSAQQGRTADELIQDAVVRYFDDEAASLAAVDKGLAAAERGEFIEEDQMNARLERMFTNR